jgi:lipid-A-disaccharide synthase-like uncharacterized protein
MHWTNLVHWWLVTPSTKIVWLFIGLLAQLLFSMRFLVQWIATEKARASIIPETFWYFSFFGGILLLAYAVYVPTPFSSSAKRRASSSTRATSISSGLEKREAGSVTAT